MIITIDDIRRLHCVRGARRWFEQNGLDFRDFLENGISEERFLATGDALAQEVVDDKRAREQADGQ